MTGRAPKEWIGKTPDSRVPPRVRKRVWEREGGRCHISGREIQPGEPWDLDHRIALCNGGENREANLFPALRDKHREKTKADVAERVGVSTKRKKNLGIRAKKSRPMPGTRASGWQHKMSGEWVRRLCT
jgi:5-methylcytosine-specific restriction protein A